MNSFDLAKLKQLARIDSTPEEDVALRASLERILHYIEQLNEVDTLGVESCRFVLKEMIHQQFREDIPQDLLPRDRFLANAPDQIGGMIRTPPVLQTDDLPS